jgi:hypothetical protein
VNPLDVQPAEVLRQRGLWVGVLPPLVFMAVRWGVGGLEPAAADAPLWPIEPVPIMASTVDVWAYFAPWLLGPLLLIGLTWLARRRGWLAAWLGVLWTVVWLSGAAGLAALDLNRAPSQLQPLPALTAEVLAARGVAPSTHGAGGVEWYLKPKGVERPQRVRVDDARASAVQPGAMIELERVRGRWWGHFVRGFTLREAAAAADAPASPAAGGPGATASGSGVSAPRASAPASR